MKRPPGMGFVWEPVPGNPRIGDVRRRAEAKGLMVVVCGITLQVCNPDGRWLQFMVNDRTLVYRHMVFSQPSMVTAVRIQPTPTFRCERCGRVLPLRHHTGTLKNGPNHYPLCLKCMETPGLLGAAQEAGYEVTVDPG